MDFIDRLRNKPIEVRKKIAFVLSASMTLVVFSLWMTVWHFNLSQKNTDASALSSTSGQSTTTTSDVDPFSAFVSIISKGWEGFTNNLSQIANIASSSQNTIQPSTSSTTAASMDSVKITQ